MSNNRTAGVIESFELDRWGSWAGARGTVKDDRDGTIFNLFSRDFKGGKITFRLLENVFVSTPLMG